MDWRRPAGQPNRRTDYRTNRRGNQIPQSLDKPHIFTPKQSVIILVGVVVAVALIVFAVLYQPKPKNGGEDLMPSGMPSGMDGMMEPNGALPMDDTGLEERTAEPADTQLDEEDLTEGSHCGRWQRI